MSNDNEVMLETESQIALNTVINKAGLWYWTYDFATGYAFLQDKCIMDFALTPVIKNFPEVLINSPTVLPESKKVFKEAMNKIKAGESAVAFPVRMKLKDGNLHWMQINVQTVYDQQHKPIKAICLGRLIDREKALEKAYYTETNRIQASDVNLLFRFTCNVTKKILVDYKCKNPESIDDFGEDFSVLMHSTLERIVSEAERENFAAINDFKFLTNSFIQGRTEHVIEYRIKMFDGRVFWVRNVLHLLQEPTTKDIFLYEYCYNIHANKMMEEMLNVMVELDFETIGSVNLKAGLITLFSGRDTLSFPSGKALDVNTVSAIFLKKFVQQEDYQYFQKITNLDFLRKKMAQQDRLEEIIHIKHSDGSPGLVKFRLFRYDKENEVCFLTGTDVTDIQREEEQKKTVLIEALDLAEKANKAKSTFLSTMSHDIRTPLNAILGMLQLSIDEPDNLSQAQESIKYIKEAADSLLNIINDILDLTRIENGNTETSCVPVRLTEVQKFMEKLYAPLIRGKEQIMDSKITVEHDDCLVDDAHLQRIAENIISNAIKYTPAKGRITIFMQEGAMGPDGANLLKFGVEDTGIGMSPDELKNIFEPFYRASEVVHTNIQGTGLGMSIAKSMTEMLGGTIEIQSTMGKGTKVTVTVPVRIAQGQDIKKAETVQQPVYKKVSLQGMNILLAEDNDINAIVGVKLLEKAGAKVIVAKDGKEALDIFTNSSQGAFGAILMDVKMPIMDGLEAAKAIRHSSHPEAKTIPIIAMTANAFAEDIRKSLDAGMNTHLSKPISPAKLYHTLERYHV